MCISDARLLRPFHQQPRPHDVKKDRDYDVASGGCRNQHRRRRRRHRCQRHLAEGLCARLAEGLRVVRPPADDVPRRLPRY